MGSQTSFGAGCTPNRLVSSETICFPSAPQMSPLPRTLVNAVAVSTSLVSLQSVTNKCGSVAYGTARQVHFRVRSTQPTSPANHPIWRDPGVVVDGEVGWHRVKPIWKCSGGKRLSPMIWSVLSFSCIARKPCVRYPESVTPSSN